MVTRFLNRLDAPQRHTREDVELEHRLVNFLQERHVLENGSLEVEAHGGVVAVVGRVPSPHAKWLCIGCCRHVAGVIKLVDEIEVSPTTRPVGVQSTADEPLESGEAVEGEARTKGRGTYVRVEPGAPRFVRHRYDSPRGTRGPLSSVSLVIRTRCDD